MKTDRTNARIAELPPSSTNNNAIRKSSQGSFTWITSHTNQSVAGKICGWVGHFGFGIVSGLYEIARNSLCPRKKSPNKTATKIASITNSQPISKTTEANISSIPQKRQVHFKPTATLHQYEVEEKPRSKIAEDRYMFELRVRSKPSRKRPDITAYTSRDTSSRI